MTTATKIWMHGLFAALIGGTATMASTIAVAPDRFNVTSWAGAGHLLAVAVVAGIVNTGAFLAKSPLPPLTVERTDSLSTNPQGGATATTTTRISSSEQG